MAPQDSGDAGEEIELLSPSFNIVKYGLNLIAVFSPSRKMGRIRAAKSL
jgi:hypothetical protein